MDELRVEIWDLLYRAEEPKSIGDIAECTGQDEAAIREAVEHEWFTTKEALVSISQPASE
jgi:hypothetical protein